MNAPDGFDETLLRSWVDEGIDVAPERPVRAALTQIKSTRQRTELRLLRRIRPMQTTTDLRPTVVRASVLIAAIVVVAVGLTVAYQALPRIGVQLPVDRFSQIAAEQIISTGIALPASTQRDGGPTADLGSLLPLFDTGQAASVRDLDGLTYARTLAFAGTSDSRRYVVSALIFTDDDQASSAMPVIEGALRPPRWFAGPDSAVEALGDEAFIYLGAQSVVVSGAPGSFQAWRRDNLVLIAAGLANEADSAASAELATAVNDLAAALDLRAGSIGD
jgi:hypothetical protein